MKQYYLNRHSEVVTRTYKEIKEETGFNISWDLLNEYDETHVTDKESYDYLKHFLGKVSVCDWNNFKRWGYVHLYPHFQELAIKNGATDKRVKK